MFCPKLYQCVVFGKVHAYADGSGLFQPGNVVVAALNTVSAGTVVDIPCTSCQIEKPPVTGVYAILWSSNIEPFAADPYVH